MFVSIVKKTGAGFDCILRRMLYVCPTVYGITFGSRWATIETNNFLTKPTARKIINGRWKFSHTLPCMIAARLSTVSYVGIADTDSFQKCYVWK
jgi:hypothetical protein